MAASIHETCDEILTNIRGCNLNYYCQETPYSIYLTIRKSWSRHHHPVQQLPEHSGQPLNLELQSQEIKSLRTECQNLRAELELIKVTKDKEIKSLNVEIRTLSDDRKHSHRETEEMMVKKDDEIKALKGAYKAKTADTEKLATEIKSLKKLLKGRDKDIHDLEKYKTNHQETLKNIKSEAKELKTDKNKLLKQVTILEKKNEELKKEKPIKENNNDKKSETINPAMSASSVSNLESASFPSTTQQTQTSSARNNSSPVPLPPFTRACSPHTPPGAPPCRTSPSLAVTFRTCEIPRQTSVSTDSISQTADAISTPSTDYASALQITQDYIVGINEIDLGPRVNDLSKM